MLLPYTFHTEENCGELELIAYFVSCHFNGYMFLSDWLLSAAEALLYNTTETECPLAFLQEVQKEI